MIGPAKQEEQELKATSGSVHNNAVLFKCAARTILSAMVMFKFTKESSFFSEGFRAFATSKTEPLVLCNVHRPESAAWITRKVPDVVITQDVWDDHFVSKLSHIQQKRVQQKPPLQIAIAVQMRAVRRLFRKYSRDKFELRELWSTQSQVVFFDSKVPLFSGHHGTVLETSSWRRVTRWIPDAAAPQTELN